MTKISKFFNEIKCKICGADNYDVVYESSYSDNITEDELKKSFMASSDNKLLDRLVKCRECGFVYINPQLSPELIVGSYSNAVDQTFVAQNENRIKTFKNSLKKVIRALNIEKTEKYKVLDIGCAGGAFPKAANDLGFQITGVEPSKWLSQYGRTQYNLDIRTGTLEDQNFQDNQFDIITLWDVLEHINSPELTLSKINKLLKKDGMLILTYPDIGSLTSKILGKNWPFLLSVHLYYFNRNTINLFLKNNGYSVEHICPYWQSLELGYVLKRAGNYFGLFNLFSKVSKTTGLYNLSIKYNMGQTLVISKKI
ncbi:MAG TPA: class I SAM-dependent methyltransferase [bacterium]|nr:class I SAM-dependent methyltransferase [bacterium]HPN32065.1 class I SAM-dependent methyltransferase [bacterium]